jgi:hypothetical protein
MLHATVAMTGNSPRSRWRTGETQSLWRPTAPKAAEWNSTPEATVSRRRPVTHKGIPTPAA